MPFQHIFLRGHVDESQANTKTVQRLIWVCTEGLHILTWRQINESRCWLQKALLKKLRARKKIFKLEVWAKKRNSLIYLHQNTQEKQGRKLCIFSTHWILKEECRLSCKNRSRKWSGTEGKYDPCWDLNVTFGGLDWKQQVYFKGLLNHTTSCICCLNWFCHYYHH